MSLAPLLARVLAAPPKLKLISLLFAGVVLALIGVSFSATRDTRVELFATPLAPEQVAEVQTRLAAWNIAFAPTPDNVRVAVARRSDILLRLSIAGVPHAHLATSTEMFAHAGALTPQSVLEAQTRDGLDADLALGLRGLDGVADARVIIAPARTGMYADEASHDASASVRITLVAGAHLNARTIAGIRAFVAGGVPGLDAGRVTVLDDRGLAVDSGTDGDPGADRDGVEVALQSALDAAFGPDATIVRVHRETIDERRDVHDTRRTPLGGAITRSTSDERYTSTVKHYTKANRVEDNGSDTHDEVRVELPGATQRRSVAVFVDAARHLDLEKIRSLAAATAGLDPERGDVLRVEAMRFTGAQLPVHDHGGVGRWVELAAFAGIVPQAIVACAIALAGFFGARPALALATKLVEAATVRSTTREVAGIPPVRVRGALVGEPPHIAAAIISALPAATATAVLELYPADERAAIVSRLARAASPLVPDAEELLRARG